VCRSWKVVVEIYAGFDANQENAPSVLGDTVVSCIQSSPFDPIPCRTIAAKLIVEQSSALSIRHSVHIFDDKRNGLYASQCPVELPIEEIDWRSPITLTTLSVALARIATDEQFSSRKFIVFGNIAKFDFP
jgi:hypothetical protein